MLELLNQRPFDRTVFRTRAGSMTRRFLPQADGGFDYFPRGLRKPGYHIDSGARDRISQALRSLDREWSVLLAILFALIVIAGAIWVRVYPSSDSSLSTAELLSLAVFAAFIISLPAWVIGQRGMRRWIDEFLRDTAVRRLSEEEYRGLIARSWTDLPRNWKIFKFLCGVGIVATSAWTADVMLTSQGTHAWLGVYLGVYLAAYAALSAASVVQLAIEALRAERWSRSVRG
jgi:hypothetical protein